MSKVWLWLALGLAAAFVVAKFLLPSEASPVIDSVKSIIPEPGNSKAVKTTEQKNNDVLNLFLGGDDKG